MEYARYANVETNLFPHIRAAFALDGSISPLDLWAILAWKANRKKNTHLTRFKRNNRSFADTTSEMARRLIAANSDEERLRLLLDTPFSFLLPTATAVLSVLYPDVFPIYDKRVCDTLVNLGSGDFSSLKSKKGAHHRALWTDYQEFTAAVRGAAPHLQSLREIDHYLWGRSWVEDNLEMLR